MTQSIVATSSTQSSRRRRFVAAVIALVCGACGAGPTTPTPQTFGQGFVQPALPAPTTVATARAALTITSFELRFARTFFSAPSGLYFLYEPSIALVESQGPSGVVIDSVFLVVEGWDAWPLAATACRGDAWVISPGGTSTVPLHPGCTPLDSPVDLVGKEVRPTVIFKDDRGDVGQVTGTTVIAAAAVTAAP